MKRSFILGVLLTGHLTMDELWVTLKRRFASRCKKLETLVLNGKRRFNSITVSSHKLAGRELRNVIKPNCTKMTRLSFPNWLRFRERFSIGLRNREKVSVVVTHCIDDARSDVIYMRTVIKPRRGIDASNGIIMTPRGFPRRHRPLGRRAL